MANVTFEPGPGLASLRDVQFEKELDLLADEQLLSARKAAENWRTGLAGLAALVTTVSVVKGPESISDLPGAAAVVLGVLVACSLGASLVGATIALRAAHGWPRITVLPTSSELRTRRFREAEKVRKHLVGAIVSTYLAVAFLAGAVAVSWYAAEDPPVLLKVDSVVGQFCGRLEETDAGSLRLEQGDASRVISYPDLKGLAVVSAC